VQVLHFVGRGKVKAAAGYAVLELDASGGGTRTVNARHFAGLLAQQAALQLVVLQPSSPSEQFTGLEDVLHAQGVAAALITPALPTRAGAFAGRLYGALAAGATLEQACEAREALVGEPAQSAAVRLAAARPAQVATARASEAGPPEGSAKSASDATPPPTADPEQGRREQRERDLQRALAMKRAAGQFDVFMCHNHVDKPAVKDIANALKARGLLPWLDQWELPPGQPWQPLLERQIGNIRAAAVCVGRAGVGPWQEQELARIPERVRVAAGAGHPAAAAGRPGQARAADLPEADDLRRFRSERSGSDDAARMGHHGSPARGSVSAARSASTRVRPCPSFTARLAAHRR
jgi:hypothetical protein